MDLNRNGGRDGGILERVWESGQARPHGVNTRERGVQVQADNPKGDCDDTFKFARNHSEHMFDRRGATRGRDTAPK